MSITTSRSCFSNRLEKNGVYIICRDIVHMTWNLWKKISLQELLCNFWIKSNDKLVKSIYQVRILIIEGHHCNYCVTIMELIEFQMHIKCFIYICIIFLWKSCDTIVHQLQRTCRIAQKFNFLKHDILECNEVIK
jgi:hypothetical protein